PGGCGGLRVAAEFIMKANPRARIWVSDPTWPNHVPLLGTAGLQIETYPYYDYDNHVIRFEEMLAALQSANANDLLLLHGCCHNPCGADLSADQWQAVRDLALDKGLTVFIDLAYQGLGDGLEEDVYGVRLLAASLPELLVVSSCSKNFGLYRERVGALTVICQSGAQRAAVSSQLASIAR
ncbi:MAG: aminotransferase class I/II-fold pyridoxal phosphate-dependent enzyme, partial [Halioglobus sp.]|nr:aminotransferase class I/II-fold pyridoxal phosphate-dependent enzyme [Halioglobus sp.]